MIQVPDKICGQCGQRKIASEFSPNRRTRFGLAKFCKSCINELQRGQRAVLCTKCGEVKMASEFARNRWRPGGRSSWCKACDNARRPCDNARRRHSIQSPLPPGCSSCERPQEQCIFPITRAAVPHRSSWCIDCHVAFRNTLTPEQAEAEARRWIVPTHPGRPPD